MAIITLHRKNEEIKGKKDLSANTLASFLVTQGVASVADLQAGNLMNGPGLEFLNRSRAIGYWLSEGRLTAMPGGYALTPDGLDEVHSREAGVAVDVNGKKKAFNVTPELVRAARMFILWGEPGNTLVMRKQFDLPAQPA